MSLSVATPVLPRPGPPARLRWPVPTWHGLLLDLLFGGVILVLSGAHAFDATGAQRTWLVLAFCSLWSIWALTVMIVESVPMSASRVGLIAVQTILMLLAAITADVHIQDRSDWFGLVVAGAVVTLLPLNWLSGRLALQPLDRALIVGAVLAFIVGIPIQSAWWWVVWGGAATLLVAVTLRVVHALGSFDHLRHRLGELSMIVFGEALLKACLTASEATLSWSTGLGLVASVGIVTCLWWAYFLTPQGLGRIWVAAHVPLHIGVIALAVGMGAIVANRPVPMAGGLAEALIFPLGLAFAGLALMGFPRHHGYAVPAATAAVALGVGGWWLHGQQQAGLVQPAGVTLGGLALVVTVVATLALAVKRSPAS